KILSSEEGLGMTILDRIVEKKKERLVIRKREMSESMLERSTGSVKPFFAAGATLITECKKGSPSKGIMVEDYRPVEIARAYERGGSDSLSILTEEDFFFGKDADLIDVRRSVSLPILRKDFMIDPYQIKESYAIGADAILLIAAILSDEQMAEFSQYAFSYGLSVLAEAHDEKEIERIARIDGVAIGINARDLRDFSVDLDRVSRMRSLIPEGRIAVAESGIKSVEDAVRLRNSGFDAFLIGERFVRDGDPSAAVNSFSSALKGGR
ncbi:MAG TPA: indole-3-glycerol phosphate synthase TrpC, partial [Spirochaetota bacterium]